jgi:hypothetical protein
MNQKTKQKEKSREAIATSAAALLREPLGLARRYRRPYRALPKGQ